MDKHHTHENNTFLQQDVLKCFVQLMIVKDIVLSVNIIFLLLTPKMCMILSQHTCKSSDKGIFYPFSTIYFNIQFLIVLFSFLCHSIFFLFLEGGGVLFCFNFGFQRVVTRIFDLISIFIKNLVYERFVRTTSNWCTHDENVTFVQCAFNLYRRSHPQKQIYYLVISMLC